MRYKFLVILAFLLTAQPAFAGNYVLTINNKPYELSLGEAEKVKVGDQYFTVKIAQKDILTYKSENFSFQYPSKYAPSKSDLGDGMLQTVMMTPLGNGIIIQEYLDMDPTNLLDLMVNEITKEEREYGYKIDTEPKSITLSDGVKLTGKVVTSRYKGSDIKRYFYMYGIKDAGIFIMTQMDYETDSSDNEMIEKLIDSLLITMK